MRCCQLWADCVPQPSPGTSLIAHFDEVPPYCLDPLVTLRREVLVGFRVVECLRLRLRLRLLQAVPFVDANAFGRRRPFQCNNPSSGAADRRAPVACRAARTCGVYAACAASSITSVSVIALSFRLDLSMQPLHSRCTERGTRNDGQYDLKLRIHDAFLSNG
jgi:hypothetical protein